VSHTQKISADQAVKPAVSSADRHLEAYDIHSSTARRLSDLSIDFEIADAAFLPFALTLVFILAKASLGLV
jgi:hypothetical protein